MYLTKSKVRPITDPNVAVFVIPDWVVLPDWIIDQYVFYNEDSGMVQRYHKPSSVELKFDESRYLVLSEEDWEDTMDEVNQNETDGIFTLIDSRESFLWLFSMITAYEYYEELLSLGVSKEEASSVLPSCTLL